MASGTSSGQKRNSFHRFSQSILHLASPPFVRGSFDAPSFTPRKRTFASRPSVGTSSLTLSDTRDSQSVYNPTATFTSAADSQMTSSPLLPSTPQSPNLSPNLPVPPTTNDLSEEEKLRLMRKVRKLSRVLGEVPVPTECTPSTSAPERIDELEELPSPPRPSTPLPSSKVRSASESAKKAFRRSLTFGQNGTLPPMPDMHRAKSLSTLRPSLNIVVGPHSEVPTPSVSPITFAWPEGEGPPPEVPASARSAPESLSMDLHDVSGPRMKRRNSTASSILLADQNTEQIQWARAAKLSRHFGTTIPPEVLRRAASPPLRTPSPDASFGRVYQSDELPKRSASLRGKTRATRHQRPLSLDLRDRSSRDAANPGSTSTAPSSPPGDNFHNVGSLRRSKSMWAQGASKEEAEQYATRDGGFSLDGGSVAREPLSEKQRALNVKRARKMAQLFGDNPPTALFQITNFKPVSAVQLTEDNNPVGHGSADGHHRFERDSLATIISISTSSTLSKIRDSYLSVVTTSSEVSGLLLEGVDDADAQVVSVETPSQPTMLPIAQPKPRRSRSNIRPSTSPAPSRPASPPQQLYTPSSATHPPRTPQTPPPFSNLISEPQRPATAPPVAAPDFQHRRRRAAKLSKFFGVEVNQLADVLPSDQPMPLPSRKPSLVAGDAPIDTVPAVTFGEASIVIDGRKRGFLGFDNDAKELDMNDAIDKLRRMKV